MHGVHRIWTMVAMRIRARSQSCSSDQSHSANTMRVARYLEYHEVQRYTDRKRSYNAPRREPRCKWRRTEKLPNTEGIKHPLNQVSIQRISTQARNGWAQKGTIGTYVRRAEEWATATTGESEKWGLVMVTTCLRGRIESIAPSGARALTLAKAYSTTRTE